MVIAVGRRDVPDRLPSDLRTREVAPRTRRGLDETLLVVDDATGATWLRSRGSDEADTSDGQATAA